MKEKAKNYIFFLSIVYSITIIILIIFTYFNAKTEIELYDTQEHLELIKTYRNELINISNITCRNSLEIMIDNYEKTSFNGTVELNEIANVSSLNNFSTISENCNLNQNENLKSEIASDLLVSSLMIDEEINDFEYQYEIKFTDFVGRNLLKNSDFRYLINRNRQISAIKKIIDFMKESENNG